MKEEALRIPTQKRAIEKKEKILEYGFKLMCAQGYHNTDCIQIAKAADVSTGLSLYAKDMMFPIININIKKIPKENLKEKIKSLINIVIKNHNISYDAHKEITAMSCTDPAISKILEKYELEATETLVKLLEINAISNSNIYEKAHLIHSWIDNLCHEVVYHKHENINPEVLIDYVVDAIINLINE